MWLNKIQQLVLQPFSYSKCVMYSLKLYRVHDFNLKVTKNDQNQENSPEILRTEANSDYKSIIS